jgi:hypothetical protein
MNKLFSERKEKVNKKNLISFCGVLDPRKKKIKKKIKIAY